MPLQPGNMLLFGGHLAHRSAANKASESRSSVYARYHGKDKLNLGRKYYEDRRVNFPPDHGKLESYINYELDAD